MFTEWQINVELPMVKDYSPPAAVNSSVFPELEFGRSKELFAVPTAAWMYIRSKKKRGVSN